MHILTRFTVYWGSALGVFISHLPARNPLGKYDILSKEGCLGSKLQGPSENKILMIDFDFDFRLLGRDFSTFFQNIHITPSSTRSLSHLVCFILLKEWCSPTLILFQRATLSQPQQPCQEKER